MAKTKNIKYLDALQTVVNVVNEAGGTIKDTNRTIANSAIPDILAGALGAGIGGIIPFAALYGFGDVGLIATGLTSGLAVAGGTVTAILGTIAMVTGIFVLAAPVAGLAEVGVVC